MEVASVRTAVLGWEAARPGPSGLEPFEGRVNPAAAGLGPKAGTSTGAATLRLYDPTCLTL